MNREFQGGHAALRLTLFGTVLALLLAPALAAGQSVADKYQRMRERQSAFNLSSAPTTVLQVNKFQCGLRNQGDTCTNVFNSPTGGGGFWPTGTPDQYMFNSGIQVLGQIPADANFEWAGDTVGAFFMDASGLRAHGTPVTEIYNSLDAGDLANWPDAGSFPDFPEATAWVRDTDLFNDVLIGRKAASQQDSWVMYWDGDPGPSGGRDHPMGILVEQRSLAWNYPAGNEAIIYFIYKFTNVTNNPLFQRLNETKFFGGANALPDEGWRFENIYVSYDSDPDVTHDYDKNYATGILPFNLGLSYEGTFFEPEFDYPPSEFFPPFFTSAPGIIGIKFLKSPVDPATGEEVGLTSLSLHCNSSAAGCVFFDPRDVQQGWRYVSLNVDAGKGDPPCTFSVDEIKDRRACSLSQTQTDVRFFIGSGPFSLDPGQSATIAVAMYAAATVATPLIELNGDNKPGFTSLQPGCPGNDLRPIDVASGWVRTLVCPEDPNEAVNQHDVEVVPGSLLGKALVAQAIFDNKFLLGFAPEPPNFYLVPGDDQVTVVWEPSRTEQEGDPFFVAAGDPASPLYDPNYREFDVEGYRIWRGTNPGNLELIAQFDKSGSVYEDHLCLTDPSYVAGDPCEDVHVLDINGSFVQYPTGGVVRLADGSTLVVKADTAMSAQINSGNAQRLSNTGVPFAFVDNGARNGFQYFYRVTAFDVNSLRSGPSSLESAAPSKSTQPRRGAPNQVLAAFNSFLAGQDGEPLDTRAPLPTIDPDDGTFDGPMPPTNGTNALFAPLVERLLPAFRLTARIDSVVGEDYITGCPVTGGNALGTCWRMYMTFDRDGQISQSEVEGMTPVWSAFGANPSELDYRMGSGLVPGDANSLTAFNIPTFDFTAVVDGKFREYIRYSAFEGQANRRFGSARYHGGSRWFDGTEETVADPTMYIRVGHLEGIDTVWAPIHHTARGNGIGSYPASGRMQCFGYGYAALGRAADVQVTWQGGTFGSVVDVAHNVDVIFKPNAQASYGFLNTDADGDGVVGWSDFNYLDNISVALEDFGFCGHSDDPSKYVQLEQSPRIVPVSTEGNNQGSNAQTGMGFGLYIDGERYIFQTSSLPSDGTVWTLRTYVGTLTADGGSSTDDPSGYAFSGLTRPPMVPGLTFVFESTAATELVGDPDLEEVHTVPDPYYGVSQFDLSPASKELKFVNLPVKATIRIYSMSGVLVDVLNHDDPTGGGQEAWNLRNRSNQFVASGVYFFHVSTPDGDSRIGKFTVVNSGFAR